MQAVPAVRPESLVAFCYGGSSGANGAFTNARVLCSQRRAEEVQSKMRVQEGSDTAMNTYGI